MAHAINLNAYADTTGQPGIFARLRQNIADYREYLATYDELNSLSDRELADLGLSRLNVRDVAREAAYGITPTWRGRRSRRLTQPSP